MSQLLKSTLREVLVDDGRVALPSLGTFIRQNHSAVLNGADRKILPPSARVAFNDNLVVNDGRLLRALVERKGLLRRDAERDMQSFIAHIRSELKAGEHVVFDGIGRLHKRYDDRISFTSATEGLSKKSFGLPPVGFSPIKRIQVATSDVADPLAAAAYAASPPPATEPALADSRRGPRRAVREDLPKEAWYAVAIILLMLVCWALWGLFTSIGGNVTDNPRQPIVNRDAPARVAPTRPNSTSRQGSGPGANQPATAPVSARTITPDEPPRLNDARRTASTAAPNPSMDNGTTEDPPRLQQESPSVAPLPGPVTTTGRNTAIIAIGLYGNEANVDKNVRRIEQAGFIPFTERSGRYTRVGVSATYDSDVERANILKRVRERFTQDAFVMRINGRDAD